MPSIRQPVTWGSTLPSRISAALGKQRPLRSGSFSPLCRTYPSPSASTAWTQAARAHTSCGLTSRITKAATRALSSRSSAHAQLCVGGMTSTWI